MFFDEWSIFLDEKAMNSGTLLIMGDINFHLDDNNNADASRFLSSQEPLGMTQLVQEPTHCKGH